MLETNQTFNEIFSRLKSIMISYEGELEVKVDTDENYYLDTKHVMEHNKKPLFFGAVQIKKNYVSYHLMPVYACPDLLENLSANLKKRMQGKSCFNFKKVDEEVFQELGDLTKKGFEKFKRKNLI
ncbi:hypothetical protein RCG23_09380 [Neobacillus sp. PS3-34]|uniref:hypothetical protein n=1 Tax=Neobacillus sp. PS3-34 TaxID=3070678 RepID=UPI0027E0294B|nr:hypothetical protein [Neobacillus sp. PS3-34]WML50032.1 hypothetical protein RCG23_09380 [Neobacillus sp. PS3-34]